MRAAVRRAPSTQRAVTTQCTPPSRRQPMHRCGLPTSGSWTGYSALRRQSRGSPCLPATLTSTPAHASTRRTQRQQQRQHDGNGYAGVSRKKIEPPRRVKKLKGRRVWLRTPQTGDDTATSVYAPSVVQHHLRMRSSRAPSSRTGTSTERCSGWRSAKHDSKPRSASASDTSLLEVRRRTAAAMARLILAVATTNTTNRHRNMQGYSAATEPAACSGRRALGRTTDRDRNGMGSFSNYSAAAQGRTCADSAGYARTTLFLYHTNKPGCCNDDAEATLAVSGPVDLLAEEEQNRKAHACTYAPKHAAKVVLLVLLPRAEVVRELRCLNQYGNQALQPTLFTHSTWLASLHAALLAR